VSDKTNIYLIGPMGSGKTAVGRQLARDLGRPFLDTDVEIERRTGVDIPYIFEKEGEAGFREREREMIAELSATRNAVIATGGGAVLDEANRARLATTGVVVFLRTEVDEQLKRTRRTRTRPLLMTGQPRKVLSDLMAVRQPIYEALADICVDTTGRRVKWVATTVRELLETDGPVVATPGAS
jgi:shikimate kinase